MPNNPSSVMRTRRADFHTREAEDGGQVVEGYFVVFEQPYYVDDFFEEIVCRGAIDAATDTSDVRALIDHDSRLVLGRANDNVNTLSWSIDDTGVFATIQINELDTDAVNLHARTQRGDVDQASFGFDEDDVEYVDLPDGRVQRRIRHISKLWELSVCTFPAYEQTFVSARARCEADIRRERTRIQKEKLKRRFYHAPQDRNAE